MAALQGAIVQMGTELCQVGERMTRHEELVDQRMTRLEALMARQEELALARDANIQALLLRLFDK